MANQNKEQARAINHIDGPCLVLAGPGSGKTFTLVERIRHMIEDCNISPESILVITFSKKASMEMSRRFYRTSGNKTYPVCFGTFHAIFYSIIKSCYNMTSENILNDKEKINILKRVLKKLNKDITDESFIIELLQEIGLHKVGRNAEINNRFDSINTDEFQEIFNNYTDTCKRLRKIDFDDMLYMCRDILVANPKILDFYRSLYNYILIDEFQDINDIQYEVIRLLLGDNNNIFVVGDDDQAIYGFRGSNPRYMRQFIDDFTGCEVIKLTKNYRCKKIIIEHAQKLIKVNTNRLGNYQFAPKRTDDDEGSVIIKTFESEELEANFVLEELKKLSNIYGEANNIAIIYRTARCVDMMEEMLRLNGYFIERKSDKNSYYESEFIKDIIAYLRVGISVYESSDVLRIINKPERNLERDDFIYDNGNTLVKRFYSEVQYISQLNPYAAVMYILKRLKYERYLVEKELKKGRRENEIAEEINKLLKRASQYEKISDWLRYIDASNNENNAQVTFNDNNNSDQYGKVVMQTAHASKGLEYDTVFIVGLQEGIFPHRRALSLEQIEEERRLLYVAMTRAKNRLYVIGRGEEKNGKRISRFISEIT